MKQLLLMFAGIALTAICWGSYGIVLHKGQDLLGHDRLKPLICVGFSYFIVAIILPTAFLASQGKLSGDWSFGGISWSMAAGCAGAFGALGIILAMSSGGKPWVVMPLVFGFAPIITAFVSIYLGNLWDKTSPVFYAGLIMVVAGAVTVLVFAPKGKPPTAKANETHAEAKDHAENEKAGDKSAEKPESESSE